MPIKIGDLDAWHQVLEQPKRPTLTLALTLTLTPTPTLTLTLALTLSLTLTLTLPLTQVLEEQIELIKRVPPPASPILIVRAPSGRVPVPPVLIRPRLSYGAVLAAPVPPLAVPPEPS